jgi:outer membrane protein TolC
MTIKKMLVLLFGVAFSVGYPCVARGAGEESLRLQDVLRLAYVNHPRMQTAKQDISAAKGRWIQAEALPDPEVLFDVGGLKEHVKNDGDRQIRKANLDVAAFEQPLDPLGTRFLRGRMAWDEVKIAKGSLELTWASVRQEVIGIYADILTSEKALEIAKENLGATRQLLARVEARYQSGSALQSDVLRSKIEVSRGESDVLVAEKNLRISNGELNLALGRSVESPLRLSDDLAYDSLQFQYSQVMSRAVEKRADIRNESIRLKTKQKGFLSALLKVILPKMGIGIERITTDYDNDTAVLLKASYPVWGFNFGEVREAKAEKEKQQIVLEALKREVGLEAYAAFLETDLADKQVALQRKALDAANELLRQITSRYETGEAPFWVYLENLKTIKEIRLAYFNALKNYKEKVAELERVIQATPTPEGVQP